MSAYKKSLTTVVFLMFLGAASLFSGGTTAFAFVVYGEFGEVPLGVTNVSTVQIIASSTNGITLTALRLEKGDSSEFSIKTTLPEGGIRLLPNESVGIEVAYSPTVLGAADDVLFITTNDPWVLGFIVLTGTGVEAQAPQTEMPEIGGVKGVLIFFDNAVADGQLEGKGKGKSAQKRLKAVRNQIKTMPGVGGVKGVLNFFDNAVADGQLEGKGKGKSAQKRLKAVRNQIKSTKKMLKADKKNKACKRLGAISNKLGTHVQGDAVEELSAKVSKLIEDLGCK